MALLRRRNCSRSTELVSGFAKRRNQLQLVPYERNIKLPNFGLEKKQTDGARNGPKNINREQSNTF